MINKISRAICLFAIEKRCNISQYSCFSCIFFQNLQRYKTINQNVMNERFPYGYDLNAYIDKAFDQMKADFPWATRDMIAEHTYYGIEKVGDDYQYVRYYLC